MCAQLRSLGLWLLLLLGPHILLSAAQTYTPCPDNDSVCAGTSVGGMCCANGDLLTDASGSFLCQGSGHCTPAISTSSLPVTSNFYNYGTAGGVLGAGGTAVNAGTGKMTPTTATCGDSTLPARYTNSALCDKSKVYNTCVRGSQTIAAQQSQIWCQLDGGNGCPADLPPMLIFGEAVSASTNIIGAVSNNRQPFVNRFVTPSGRCYGPSNAITSINNNAQYYQVGVVGQDMCVRITCDSSQTCNVQLSLLFTCYNPCNNCPSANTASCASVAGGGTYNNLPTAQCTCKAGWSGSTCTTMDGGWSAWSACSLACGSGTQTRSCTNPSPSGGGATCSGVTVQSCNTQICSTSTGSQSGSSTSTGSQSGSRPVQPAGNSCSCSCCAGNDCSPALEGYTPITSCGLTDCNAQCRSSFSTCLAGATNGIASGSCSSTNSGDGGSSGGDAVNVKAFEPSDGGVLRGWSSSTSCTGSAAISTAFTVGDCITVPPALGGGSIKVSGHLQRACGHEFAYVLTHAFGARPVFSLLPAANPLAGRQHLSVVHRVPESNNRASGFPVSALRMLQVQAAELTATPPSCCHGAFLVRWPRLSSELQPPKCGSPSAGTQTLSPSLHRLHFNPAFQELDLLFHSLLSLTFLLHDVLFVFFSLAHCRQQLLQHY